jgi:hypothetical protein
MSGFTGIGVNSGVALRLAVLVLIAVLAGSCAQLREVLEPSPPAVAEEWTALLDEIRAFERRIGFRDTDNFRDFSEKEDSFPFCGYVSRLYLPYSYEDPAIRWLDSVTEEECRERGRDADVYFGAVEAWGEVGTPVTPSMIAGKLDRFIYLVIHENCHDQFDLPYGIEEALCNLITYRAMAAFSEERFGAGSREHKAVQRYAGTQSRLTRATIAYYERLAALYARFGRAEISQERLLQQRAAIFREAERVFDWPQGTKNNVTIANEITYSRHYPFLENVHDALGRDLARTVAFFRHVDKLKPSKQDVMKRHRIAAKKSVEFIRTYEAAVVETIEKALAESK